MPSVAEMRQGLRLIVSLCGEQLLTDMQQDDDDFYPPRDTMKQALRLLQDAEAGRSSGMSKEERKILTRAYANLGYIYELLLEYDALSELGKLKLHCWPYPLNALGAMVGWVNTEGSDRRNSADSGLEVFAGLCRIHKHEQVRQFLTNLRLDGDVPVLLRLIIRQG